MDILSWFVVSYFGKNSICISHSDDKLLSNSIHDTEDQDQTKEGEKKSMQEILKEVDMVLIYLSKSFITSTKCLDELDNIFKSKMQNGHKFFPFFCGLDRSQVKKQTLDSFGMPLNPKSIQALRKATEFEGFAIPNQADLHQSGINSDIRKAIDDNLKKPGSKVVAGSIKGLMPRTDIIKFEATGFPNQEGEGSSSKETQEDISIIELKSCLQHISDASKIPPSELEEMYTKKILDMSSNELTYLPQDIGKLDQLECLKVSFYRLADKYIKRKNIDAIIPRGELSKLQHLKELSINLDPDCEWWDAEAKAIIDEILGLEKLEILNFYFPTEDLLKQFLKDDMKVYKVLLDFRLTVGRHDPEIVYCVPLDLQQEFEKSKKCLKYVGGEVDNEIGRVLEHAESLFLDRHWTTKKLSEFNLCNLVCCLLVECNDMKSIFDGSDFVSQEKSPQNLRFLSVHHMEKVQCLWTGPIFKGCLEKLEILILHTLPELITIFTPDLLRNLRNLKQVIVKNCPKVTSLITEKPQDSNSSSGEAFAPNLQIILLVHLPKFTSFSSFLNEAPKLEKVVVYNCRNLKKPSSSDKLYSIYHEIQDGYDWSKEISNRNETEYMHRIFVDLKNQLDTTENSTYPTTLPKEFHYNQDARTDDLALIKDVQKKDLIEQDIFWIYGKAGIGKTTMVESVYNSNYDKFEVSCFLSNIGKYSKKPNGLLRLQAHMLASILPGEKPVEDINDIDEGKLRIKDAVKDKKALIVLDDVDHLSQVEALIGKQDWYSRGSKIIVTVMDMALVKGYDVRNRHEVKILTDTESRELFSLHAFGTYKPKTGYEDISMKLVDHCGKMPLALVILGSSLCDSSIDDCTTVNEKLNSNSHPPQQEDILKVCFDSARDKELFLYIAYFFVGKDRYYVITILEGCDFHAGIGIRTLADRCLLTIGRDKKLQMHQLLQVMATNIVQNEKWAKNLIKVWKHLDDVDFHLREKKDLQESQGLIVDLPMAKESSIETDVFIGMDKLRLLKLNNVQLSGGYANFPNNLVWLSWRGFPICSLPSDFPMKRIVVLDMDYRSLKQIWHENMFPETLKILNLSHSDDLICTPNFSSLRNLESLILKHCVNLEEVHESVADLENIRFLNLRGCKNLKKFPAEIISKRSFDKVFLSRYSLHLIQPQQPAELNKKLDVSN